MSIEVVKDNLHGASECPGLWPATDATAVVQFKVEGLLRFLSHAETVRVLQRACARAALPVKYTQGFNPHPKMSLPLPRTVGVASDDERLVLRLFREQGIPDGPDIAARRAYEVWMKETLNRELPEGMEVLSVELLKSGVSPRPRSAVYEFPVLAGVTSGEAGSPEEKIERVLTNTDLIIERSVPKSHTVRRIDVRPFLTSITWRHGCFQAECDIAASGSIRVEEMMQVLELKTEDLAGPIRRTHVRWDLA
jgi:radical SAM-linked protein